MNVMYESPVMGVYIDGVRIGVFGDFAELGGKLVRLCGNGHTNDSLAPLRVDAWPSKMHVRWSGVP